MKAVVDFGGLEVEDGWFEAWVRGTEVYEVEIAVDPEDGLYGSCDCPYGQEGNFCKHCVAVGLAVLSRAREVPGQRSAAVSRAEGPSVGWGPCPARTCWASFGNR